MTIMDKVKNLIKSKLPRLISTRYQSKNTPHARCSPTSIRQAQAVETATQAAERQNQSPPLLDEVGIEGSV